MEQYSLYFVIALISLVFAAATIILGRKQIHRVFFKYIPAIIAAVVTLALVIKTVWFSEGFEGLGYAILGMISAIVFLISIVAAVVMEIVNRKGRHQ